MLQGRDTLSGFVLLRSNPASHSDADVAKSAACGKQIKVYPLAQAKNSQPTNFTDACDMVLDGQAAFTVLTAPGNTSVGIDATLTGPRGNTISGSATPKSWSTWVTLSVSPAAPVPVATKPVVRKY